MGPSSGVLRRNSIETRFGRRVEIGEPSLGFEPRIESTCKRARMIKAWRAGPVRSGAERLESFAPWEMRHTHLASESDWDAVLMVLAEADAPSASSGVTKACSGMPRRAPLALGAR